MIKIIKEGKKEFIGICPICGCKFSYQASDIELGAGQSQVHCPQCERVVRHTPVDDRSSCVPKPPHRISSNINDIIDILFSL